MNSLEIGEKIAAKDATAPRVTLDSMKSRIAREYYFTAGEAIAGKGDPLHSPRDPLDVLTICVLTLDNGWTLLGKSAPASVENFDAEKGRHFAYEDALKQLWPLEGYLLREQLYRQSTGDVGLLNPPKVLIPPHDDLRAFVGIKIINARPMTRGIYCQFRGWNLPADENGDDAGYFLEYTDKIQDPPTVPGFKGYVSWSPADVFEAAYMPHAEQKSTARQSDTGEVLGDGVAFMKPEDPEPLPFS